MEFRVISIGTLSRHPHWPDHLPPRTAHATTTLVRSGEHCIIVDPGLPGQVLAARLIERSGLTPDQITDVFLTNFRPAHRWGLDTFPNARWLISEMEREAVGQHLIQQIKQETDTAKADLLRQEIETLRKFTAAPDRICEQVDLFPLPGFTPGTCGLLLLQTNSTTLLASDAAPTAEHIEQGQVLSQCIDTQQARESFMEAMEIADVIIPGHDNVLINPTRRAI